MNAITFNADTFAADKRAFGNAMRSAEGKGDNFARVSLAALITNSLSAMALAISVFDEFEPKNASGKACEPKESEKAACGVSVSSLRNAKGGEGARSTLEAVLYVFENREQDMDAVSDFILAKRNALKLFPLKRHLQAEKAKAARAEAEATDGAADAAEPKEGMDDIPAIPNPLAEAIELLQTADGDWLSANEETIGLLLIACQDAASRLAAADELRKAA